jgi:hypothetical protein
VDVVVAHSSNFSIPFPFPFLLVVAAPNVDCSVADRIATAVTAGDTCGRSLVIFTKPIDALAAVEGILTDHELYKLVQP